jgi:prepilin-type N-terminal cleavage/methylation domain-containing protein
MSLKSRHQRGDTIIEVMIVLAILGLAISISYATANRSLLNTRQAQEDAEASEYVQSQIEGINALDSNVTIDNGLPLSSESGEFCITNPDPSSPVIQQNTHVVPAPPVPPCSFGSLNYNVVIVSCDSDFSDPLCSYAAAVTNPPTQTYVVQAKWPDVFGEGYDTVTQVYRDHPSVSP